MAVIISLIFIWTLCLILLFINPQNKSNLQASILAILIVPPTLFGLLFNSINPIFGTDRLWGYIISGIIIFYILYGYFLIQHGFLGMSIRFGHIFWDIDGPVVKGGDVLRHAMKNELVKMSLCSRNIEALGLKLGDETFPQSIRENAKNIQVSADYLLQLMKRIQDYTREITLVESRANLFEILEDAIDLVQSYLQAQQITIQRNFLPAQMNFF